MTMISYVMSYRDLEMNLNKTNQVSFVMHVIPWHGFLSLSTLIHTQGHTSKFGTTHGTYEACTSRFY